MFNSCLNFHGYILISVYITFARGFAVIQMVLVRKVAFEQKVNCEASKATRPQLNRLKWTHKIMHMTLKWDWCNQVAAYFLNGLTYKHWNNCVLCVCFTVAYFVVARLKIITRHLFWLLTKGFHGSLELRFSIVCHSDCGFSMRNTPEIVTDIFYHVCT